MERQKERNKDGVYPGVSRSIPVYLFFDSVL